jgi:hypothetical protein
LKRSRSVRGQRIYARFAERWHTVGSSFNASGEHQQDHNGTR